MAGPIIDAWMQHPEGRFWGHPMFASLRRWAGMGDESTPEIPDEMTLGAMDAAGVSVGVLSAWWGPEGELISNESVARLVKKYPSRFVGIASVNLRRPMEAVRELRRSVRELGLRGLRILPWLWDLPPDDRRYYPLYAECVEMGIPFCLQVGHTGPMCPSEPGRPIPYLDRVALDFPELVIVGGHIGYPWTNEMISLARKYPNVYIDTSAYKISRYPKELVDYLKSDGRKKVLFGSNYPMIMPGDSLSDLDKLGLSDEAKQAFLYDNAARIFGIRPGK
jgi:predicted TIM-barrel fold metal-dependent hydrolase